MAQKIADRLQLPRRTAKPRETGLTYVIDGGCGVATLRDLMETAASVVDCVKFGWGTACVVDNVELKISILRDFGVSYYFGGSLLEIFLLQNRLDEFRKLVDEFQPSCVEVSDGVIDFKPGQKQALIRQLAKDMRVISEVGKKDPEHYLSPTIWVQSIEADLEAGSWKVVCEAREGGSSGIFRNNGELRFGLIDEIRNRIAWEKLIFEAPTKSSQLWFIKQFGVNVNLGNIGLHDVVPLETLRLGLRADTVMSLGTIVPNEWLKLEPSK